MCKSQIQTKSTSQSSSSDNADGDDEFTHVEKVTRIFQVFSMGDVDVKSRICSKEVLLSERIS